MAIHCFIHINTSLWLKTYAKIASYHILNESLNFLIQWDKVLDCFPWLIRTPYIFSNYKCYPYNITLILYVFLKLFFFTMSEPLNFKDIAKWRGPMHIFVRWSFLIPRSCLDLKLLSIGKTFFLHNETPPSLQNLSNLLLNISLLTKPLISLMAQPFPFDKTFFLHG